MGRPNIKKGAFLRHIGQLVRLVSSGNLDSATPITHEMGSLVRDCDGDRMKALLAAELRRRVIDPNLDLKGLSGFVRPSKPNKEE